MIGASLPALLQSFLTDRLQRQRHASPHTIAGYRDSFRLLPRFAAQRLRNAPSDLCVDDLDAPFIGEFLAREEIEALLAAPDASTWIGSRDRALLLVAIQTGLRVSELIGLRCHDISLGTRAHLRCVGKGRKQRCTPLRRDAARMLRAWLRRQRAQQSPGDRPDDQLLAFLESL